MHCGYAALMEVWREEVRLALDLKCLKLEDGYVRFIIGFFLCFERFSNKNERMYLKNPKVGGIGRKEREDKERQTEREM